nr:MAG TPA: hypothetical protein [Caudoviricetes sp.]
MLTEVFNSPLRKCVNGDLKGITVSAPPGGMNPGLPSGVLPNL